MNGQKPNIIIYDFDGVIVATAGLKHSVYLETMASFDSHFVDALDHALKTELVGSERAKVARWVENKTLTVKPNDFLNEFQRTLDQAKPGIEFVDGFLEFHQSARKNGVPEYIVSAAPAHEIREILSVKGIAPSRFVRIFGQEDGTKSHTIKRLLTENGISDPTMVWFFGDMPSDFAASCDSGVRFFRIDNTLAALSSWPESAPSPVRFHQLTFN